MSTQIENLVVSFNEVLLSCGDLFDELSTNRTVNLVLPDNNKSSDSLNAAIKTFDRNLDSVLMQLSDISLLESELKRRSIERERKGHLPNIQELSQQQQAQQAQQQTQQIQAQPDFLMPNDNFSNGDTMFKDLNEFLSTVPDSTDVNMNEDFNENIQQLLMESNDYIDRNGTNSSNATNNDNKNQEIVDDDIFNEIDSMLNI